MMLRGQLWTLKSWVYLKNMQGLIRGKIKLTPTSLPALAGPQPKCPRPRPEHLYGGGSHGLHIHLHLDTCKARQVVGQLVVVVFWDVTAEGRWPNISWAFFTSDPSHSLQLMAKYPWQYPRTVAQSKLQVRPLLILSCTSPAVTPVSPATFSQAAECPSSS